MIIPTLDILCYVLIFQDMSVLPSFAQIHEYNKFRGKKSISISDGSSSYTCLKAV